MDEALGETYDGRAIVAAFRDIEDARTAARRLRDEGFRRIWIGATEIDEDGTRVAAPGDDTFGARIGRFFNGEPDERTLYHELVSRGVAEPEARRLDMTLPPRSAVLTVDGGERPERAAQIIAADEGHIVAGDAYPVRDTSLEETQFGATRQLRVVDGRASGFERRTVPAGEAFITKDVVARRTDVDVPIVHEELVVACRPVAEREADEPIGGGETIRIPLTREEVVVTKRPVVTGEVVVAKRRVTETGGLEDLHG